MLFINSLWLGNLLGNEAFGAVIFMPTKLRYQHVIHGNKLDKICTLVDDSPTTLHFFKFDPSTKRIYNVYIFFRAWFF